MFHLEWYRIFYHTAKTGNLTRAAEALFITQPTVSYAIKQMETALGLCLFQRMSKGVELTAEGRELFAFVEQAFQLLEAGERKVQELKALEAGELRIGASDSLIKHLLLPQLEQFRESYPGVRIRLSHGKTSEIVQHVKEGLIDCGLVHLPLPAEEPVLKVVSQLGVQDCFVVGEAHRCFALQPRTAEELAALPLLSLSAKSRTRQFMERWFAVEGIAMAPDVEVGSIDLLIEFAKRGFGIALINRAFVQAELRLGTLVEIPTVHEVPERKIGLVIRHTSRLSLAALQFFHSLPMQQTDKKGDSD
ncbi:UNVERIFIED_CONTAM: DNA-binding transcriptional LysR family regulator [Brevibacillus sp. OAP136]